MKRLLIVVVLAVALLGLLAAPAMAAPEPSHTYAGSVVYFTQELKGPAPVLDPDFGIMANQLGKDIIPINKGFAADLGFNNYGHLVAVLAQQDVVSSVHSEPRHHSFPSPSVTPRRALPSGRAGVGRSEPPSPPKP